MEPQDLLEELLSAKCRCGRSKESKSSFCIACRMRLSATTKAGLNRRIGEGYEEAYAEAIGHLGPVNPVRESPRFSDNFYRKHWEDLE